MTNLAAYRKQRDHLIANIAERLSKDDRFTAAWLTGSYGRNDEDSLSDIDLSLVLANEYIDNLCHRLEPVGAQTSPERYTLFSQFGKPALIHENNNNAPAGGTFTFVMYAESALMVDWVLIPQAEARRPVQSRLLFEKVVIPHAPSPEPENPAQDKKSVAEMWAFFWMMTAVTVRYIIRGDGVFAAQWIENLHGLIREIERRMDRKPWNYTRGSLSRLQPTRRKQIESLKLLCRKTMELKPRVKDFTGMEPAAPLAEVETLLSLATHGPSQI